MKQDHFCPWYWPSQEQEQRDYEDPKEVVERFATYRNHLALMGIRNSYSKTDHDATFMRMKEDHILNGQLKPANYETKKKRKTKQNIGRRENLFYLEDQDAYTCYECENCPHTSACIKTRNNANPHKKASSSPHHSSSTGCSLKPIF